MDWRKTAGTISKTTNSRSHEDVTWQKLDILDSDLASQIRDLAEEFGYEVDEKDSSSRHGLDFDALEGDI